ncbi:MAG: hypothetical protein LUD79_04650 [Oscillospiraceae bacterium]|nr:hypothetical protein [Oscillospiraceae bacterium]
MSYELPQLPAAPTRPGFLAGRAVKQAYERKSAAYEVLQTRLTELKKIHDNMDQVRSQIKQDRPEDCLPHMIDGEGNISVTCPYCLTRFGIYDLRFRSKYMTTATGDPKGFPMEEDEQYLNHWEEMGINGIEPMRGHILDMDPASGEIATITFQTDLHGGQETVPYNAAARERMHRERIRKVTDRHGLETTERVCPNCHTELPGDIGFCTNYIYSLIGNSSCGKTVYLYRLILSLTSGTFLNGAFSSAIANENTLRELKPELTGTLIKTAKECFQYTGDPLADATDVGYIPPIILKMKEQKTNQTFMITLFDYPGEAIWLDNDDFFNPLTANVRNNSEGLLFMFDSGIALDSHLSDEYRGDTAAARNTDEAGAAASDVLTRLHDVYFHLEESLGKPAAMVLSKSDLIGTCADRLMGSALSTSAPTFLQPAPAHKAPDLCDMYCCHQELITFMNTQDPGATNTARAMTDGNYAWFAVSATGVPLEYGIIPQGAAIAGLRESQPLEWLLYRNGQLSGAFPNTGDPQTVREARRWAASFQSAPYSRLLQLESDWNGEPGRPGAYKAWEQALNDYNAMP